MRVRFLSILTILLLLVGGLSIAAITKIMGGAVDGTPSPTPSPPTSAALVSSPATGGAYSIAINSSGAFAGIRAGTGQAVFSSDGITWTVIGPQPTVLPLQGVQYIGSRILVLGSTGSFQCDGQYTDNAGASGTTWTTVTISTAFGCLTDSRDGLICSGSTCIMAGRNTAAGVRVFQTTDSGTSWSTLDTSVNTWTGATALRVMAYDGSTYVVSARAIGADNSPLHLALYRTSGVDTLTPGDCGATGTYNTIAATLSKFIGFCATSTSTFRDWLGNTYSFTPTLSAGQPNITAVKMTDVSPATTLMATRETTNTVGTIYTSANDLTFTSLFSTGVNEVFGQFAQLSPGVLYVGSSTERVYKIE